MAEELQHEEMSQGLKTEQERHPSPRQAVLSDQWDSVESDTESLAQERAYQQQLHMRLGRHDQNKNILHQMEKADSLEQKGREEGDANYDETEDLQVYDSLDIAAHPNAYLDTLIDERRGTSELLTDDAYSDLRYDPNWRTNLRGAGRCNEITQISAVEYYQVPQAKCGQSCGDRRGLVIKGEYRYIADTSPAVGLTSPYMEGNESSRPYRLHLQDDQTSSVTSPHCHNKPTSPEADYSKPSYIFTKNESDKSSVKGVRKKPENSCDNAGENISRCPEWIKDKDNMFIQDFKTCQELRHTQGGPTQMQQMSTSTFPKVLLNKKLAKLPEDIVERNKVTLGRNTSKCGSYVSVYALKQEMPHNVNKVHGSLKEKSSADSQEDSADPELKTQQLRVTQISKGKKAQRKEYPNRPQQQQQQPPALGVKAEWTDCLSSPLERPAAVTQPNPQKSTSLQPLLSAFHLNLNTSSHLLPFIQHRGQDDVKNLASLHGCPASEVELTLSPECQQTIPGKSSQMSWKGVNTYLHPQNLQCCPEQWQRTTAFKWPLSREGEDHKCHAKPFLQSLPRTPSTTLSVGSSSSTVLPPIGKSTTGLEPELSPGVDTADSIHRSSSDGYLVQMEKQKQLMARVTYKAYSLKDYKQLKSDINLRGLGPDYTAIEKTAEKMKRQKLYSNVIREQNKKISRIPFLLAKDPEGNTKKVPRMKALEYAKTIAKPSVQSQPKQRQKHQSESFTEHAPYLKGMDVSQLATLEILRKRHEEEKQAVALFRKVHAV